MKSAGTRTATIAAPPPAAAAEETPWYELINDAPEPPEDAMQQSNTIQHIFTLLLTRYEDDPTTLVANQTNVIYDSAVPGSVVVPDVYVVLGVDAETIETYRRSYRIDEWGVAPAFVMEVASASTAHRDLGVKREIYARIGAQEYWRLDRYREYYGERLVGERLVDGEYVPFELHTEPDGAVWSRSEVLGVDFFCHVENGIGRFSLRDSATGEWLNTLGEEIAARQAAESQAAESDARAAVAEARAAAAEAELERLRRQLGQPRAAAANARAQSRASEERAAASDARAAAAEAELERLRRQLGQSQGPSEAPQ